MARKEYMRKSYNTASWTVTIKWNDSKIEDKFSIADLPEEMRNYAAMMGISHTLGDLSSRSDVTTADEFRDAIIERWDEMKDGNWDLRAKRGPMTDAQKAEMYRKLAEKYAAKEAGAGPVPELP